MFETFIRPAGPRRSAGAARGLLRRAALGLALAAPLALTSQARADQTAVSLADAKPSGPVMLTVTGAIAASNRDRYDAFADAFMKYHEKTFVRAFAFDRAMLAKLPQRTVTANAEAWPKPIEVKGPLLRDVLAALGVKKGAALKAMALDGYAAEFTAADLAAQDWILAIEANGAPLGLGGRGPSWILYGTGEGKATSDEEGKWVWSVFLIEVE